ncbi:CD1247 N-terminal domain-containing protein [Anaeromassilibacillus senegalensis]|uniref:CD1247 N-terminal domain-containing protein n=1 Tax=Anaeromassilibacillus senegalensis TaxID=1673717 RepID=UPI0006809F7A|nr:CD1247 N-terminal domain-containing protein [Anaeromassilibacillus senegalensis]
MTNTEKVAYIRGLAEGLELDGSKKEVKVLNAIIELLDDLALSMSDLEDTCNDMADQLDAVDEDLGSLEEDFYFDEDDEDDEDCFYEVTCPNCHETICLSEDIIEDGQMDCPNCGETLEFDLDECDEDCCSCGCEDCE